ncbi:DUF397 domain-containing protein [Streptomyces sp. 15-116A]|uniref:DUF397 domain-containing protein n=1 Tax=Streptomyces sp. 15-116A TaxID=2259035 RepID=UPI0021B28B5D|nr:DUF397 domain-containing protein [Streptomyces sp. 15-116A]MCT7354274.1 DUF397 domain-containing protein [Streptomyces sp. 15-116A]
MSVEDSVVTVPESAWVKSSYSSGEGGECVEFASWQGTTHVRDSKDTTGPALTLTPHTWTEFIAFATR